MDSLMAVEIKQVLEREFDVNLTAQDLRTLTFAKLQELTDSSKKGEKPSSITDKSTDDMQRNMLLRSIGLEETAYKIISPLNEIDKSKEGDAYALYIPGIEGVISPALYTLCKNIEIPIFSLQVHAHYKEETLQNLISMISQVSEYQMPNENIFKL